MRKRLNWRGFFLAFAISSIFFPLWWLFFSFGNLNFHLDDYSAHVLRKDGQAARDELKQLRNYYDLLAKLQLKWLADRFFFKEMSSYEAAYDFVAVGDYDKIRENLKNDESFWGILIRENSKWRTAQGIYVSALSKKDKSQREKEMKIADEMALETKDGYEKAIRMDPNGTWEPKRNYDLTVDPSARARGLAPKPLKGKLILGLPSNKGRPGDDKGPFNLDEKTPPNTQGGPGTQHQRRG